VLVQRHPRICKRWATLNIPIFLIGFVAIGLVCGVRRLRFVWYWHALLLF
jgi:hypothetical protein